MKFKPTEKTGGLVVELGPREVLSRSLTGEKAKARPPVFKLKKILVPVDFSNCCRKSLEYATHFARQFDAELVVVHVLRPYPPAPEMPPVDVEAIEAAKKELEVWRKTIPDPVPSHTVLRQGEPHAEINLLAEELGIDLIIISTHGRSGLARVLMGSTTEKVVRFAGCPVLVVREHEHEFVTGGNTEEAGE